MSRAEKFAATAGALYLIAGVGVPIAIAMMAVGDVFQGLRELPAHPDAMYVLSTSTTLILVVLSLVMGTLLLVRRRIRTTVFWVGVAMALAGAALSIVPALIWLIPVLVMWLANRPLAEPAAMHRPSTPASPVTGKQGVRSWLYLACLAMMGGGAILHLLRNQWLRIPSVPIVSLFEEPVAAFIHVLNLKPIVAQFGVVGALERLLAFAVSLSIAVLALRRVKLMRQSRSISAPPSFSGFPYGLAWAALTLLPAWLVLRSMALPIGGEFVAVNAFLAFVLAELPDLRDSRKRATAGSAVQISVPTAALLTRRPTWTFLSLAFPVLGGGLMVLLQIAFGGASLGTFALGLIALTASCALGLAATAIAVARKERWMPAQVVGFLVNFGVTGAFGTAVLGDVFRFG